MELGAVYFTKKIASLLIGVSVASSVVAQDFIVPPMVNIPAGKFTMGTNSGDSAAKPAHEVTVNAFQMAKYPVTMTEFRKFVADTSYEMPATCLDKLDSNWLSSPEDIGTASWDNHRFLINEFQPVTCINWTAAQAYIRWLSDKMGQQYRLPTEQEFEYATKANTTSRYFWGDDPQRTQACLYGNFADKSGELIAEKDVGASYVGFLGHANCDDGEAYIAPVGLYRPNPFGLYDMVGNINQLVGSCYYAGYKMRTVKEMDNTQCEMIGHRGESWHYPPQPHAKRGRFKRGAWSPSNSMGFRVAADGVTNDAHKSTAQFELDLLEAQRDHIATRVKLPKAPVNLQLVKRQDGGFKLSWQPQNDARVTGYDIYQSTMPKSHLIGQSYRRYYKKLKTVDRSVNEIKVMLPASGGSFRVVANTKQGYSLPSEPAVYAVAKTIDVPGKLLIQHATVIENTLLGYSNELNDFEPYYISRLNHMYEQPMVTASFKVNVKKGAWYVVNYRGRTYHSGKFFTLWQNNKRVGEINYDTDVDDRTSTRHRVYLDKGEHMLQMTVKREGFDRWSMTWIELTEANM